MIIRSSQMAKTSFNKGELLAADKPGIAFIGRSNVGKSSMINKLLHRKNLARTSSMPGKTVSINYILVNDNFYFIDLPGYGYARISHQESRRVQTLLDDFFAGVKNLKLIILLIDSRRGFLDADREILAKIIDKNFKILTVLTKSDKIAPSKLIDIKKDFEGKLSLKAFSFSIKSDTNREEILNIIDKALME